MVRRNQIYQFFISIISFLKNFRWFHLRVYVAFYLEKCGTAIEENLLHSPFSSIMISKNNHFLVHYFSKIFFTLFLERTRLMKFTVVFLTYFASIMPLSSGFVSNYLSDFNTNLTFDAPKVALSDELRAFGCVLENIRKSSDFSENESENFIEDERLTQPYRLQKVVIDPGHGGKDPGCQHFGFNEKDNALAMAKKLGKRINDEFPSVEVVYTRKTDVFIELEERAQIANRAKADLFISIHCNSTDEGRGAHGTETYVLGKHKEASNFEVSRRENASILLEQNYQENYDGFDPNSTEAYIIFTYNQKKHIEKSKLLATLVEEEMVSTSERKSLGVKQAGFWVLHRTAMPSILFEAGFLNHPKEGKFLSSDDGQDKIVDGLFNAFSRYKSSVEGGTVSEKIEKKEEKAPPPVSKPKMAAQSAKSSVSTPKPEKVAFKTAEKRSYEAPKTTEIVYKVQLAASEMPLKDVKTGKWKGLDIEVVQEDGMFKYLVGGAGTRAIADATRDRMRVRGFTTAVVVTYKEGKRVR